MNIDNIIQGKEYRIIGTKTTMIVARVKKAIPRCKTRILMMNGRVFKPNRLALIH
jgi:hypothetical protein